MTARSAFTSCCGASIISGFYGAPSEVASYKRDPSKVGSAAFGAAVYLKDKKGNPIVDKTRGDLFLDKLKEVPYQDHLFSLILTKGQYEANNMAWPAILKKAGFQFVTTFNNSVHSHSHCYLFVFARALSGNAPKNPTTPPKGWDSLASGATDGEAKAA